MFQDNFFIWGRGISDDGIRVNETVPVYVDCREPSTDHENDVKVKVVTGINSFLKFSPFRTKLQICIVHTFVDAGLELPVRRSKEGLRSTFIYTPTTTGKHLVHVTNNNEPIGQSPYKVGVHVESRSED